MVEQEPQKIADNKKEARKRGGKSFPVLTFNEALILAKGIVEHGTGNRMRRLTLFGKLDKSPTSGPSRQLVTTSARYGLTTGSYSADYLSLTGDAQVILSETSSESERRQKSFHLSIQQQSVFQQLYERLKSKRLPATDVLRDELAQIGVPLGDHDTAAEVFVQNVRDLGLIQDIAGKDNLIPIEQLLEELPSKKPRGDIKVKGESGHEIKPPTDDKKKVRFEPKIQVNIEIHISPDTQDDKIKLIFENMKTYLIDNE